jgi:hypothetical protein
MTGYWVAAVAVWGLALWCRGYARRSRERRGLRHHLAAYGVLYLVPIGIAVTINCVLDAVVRATADGLRAEQLITLQRRFEAVSAFFSQRLKLTEAGVLALLLVVHLITCLLAARHERTAGLLHRGVDAYTRYSGPVAAGLATLAAFTLLGLNAGAPAEDYRLRLKIAQQGYAEVSRRVEAQLSQQVADGLFDKVSTAMPGDYRAALAQEPALADLVDTASTDSQAAKTAHGVKVAALDRAVAGEQARRGRTVPEFLRVAAEGRTLPAAVTPEQVEAARPAVGRLTAPDGVDLVGDGRRKMVLQLEKLTSERVLALAKPLFEAAPITEPLVQAFAESIDQTLQDRLGSAYDRIMGRALAGERDLDAVVRREAAAVVEQTDVKAPVARQALSAHEAAHLRILLMAGLRAGSLQLTAAVTKAKAAERAKAAQAEAEAAKAEAAKAEVEARRSGRLPELRPLPPELRLPPRITLPPSWSDPVRPPLYGDPAAPRVPYRPPLEPFRPVPPVRPPVRPPIIRPPIIF